MNTSKLALGAMLALAMSNLSYAETADTAQDCQTKTSNAYIQLAKTLDIDQKREVGSQFASFINQIEALEKTGHFKNMEIISPQLRLEPSYQYKTKLNFSIHVTVVFDYNLDAHRELAKLLLPHSSLNIRTDPKIGCNH